MESNIYKPRTKQFGTYKSAFNPYLKMTYRRYDENKIHDHKTVPEILDVSITKKCNNKCSYCYTNSGDGYDMSLDDAHWLLENSMDELSRPYQVALGGGEPGKHPHFIEMLQLFSEYNIVPNYTTNGYTLMDDKTLEVTNKLCGGVALTYHWEYTDKFDAYLSRLMELDKCQKNIHLVVHHNVINELPSLIDKYADT